MPSSLHSHSGEFCAHATGRLEEMVKSAMKQKFRIYGMSEHVPRLRMQDLYDEELTANVTVTDLENNFEDYLRAAKKLQNQYSGTIDLLVGAETEYITQMDMQYLDKLLVCHEDKIDYIVGSVHHVNEIPIDFSKELFEQAFRSMSSDWEEFLYQYFFNLAIVLERKPEVVAHLDLYRLYHPEIRLKDYPRALKQCLECIRSAIEYGALFECSSAPFRKGWSTGYPGPEMLDILMEENAKLTLSDDSHAPERIGLDYIRLRGYLAYMGVQEIYSLALVDKLAPRGLGRTKVIQFDWNEEAFWEQMNMERAKTLSSLV